MTAREAIAQSRAGATRELPNGGRVTAHLAHDELVFYVLRPNGLGYRRASEADGIHPNALGWAPSQPISTVPTEVPMARRYRARAKAPKVEWRAMPEVEALVQQMVEKHHKHLERAEIKVIGKPKAGKKLGRLVIVEVSKPTPKQRILHTDGDVHYVITIGLDAWGQLDQKKAHHREIDRALCHFTGLDEKDRWQIVAPDVQEFTAILQRHGAYNADLEIFVDAAKQLDLPLSA